MRNLFQGNGRIEQRNGLHFYEQDVIMLDYLYNGDVTINIETEYNFPGFGIVLNLYNSKLKLKDEPLKSYIIKVGSMDFAAYKKEFGELKCMKRTSCPLQPDKKTHYFRFRKSGAYIRLYDVTGGTENQVGYYKMPIAFNLFYIGLYSNKGNIVKSMDILDNRPQFWFTNIQNTNGGRVSFAQDQFLVENAERDIEVEQENIPLTAGRYYLTYKAEDARDSNHNPLDHKVFVLDSDEEWDHIHAPEKTLLETEDFYPENTYHFDLKQDMKVNILFQVNSGKISEIAIKDDYRQGYVSTDDNALEKEGSYMIIHLDGLIKAEWQGVIEQLPENKLTEEPKYSVYSYGDTSNTIENANILLLKEYNYVFEMKNGDWKQTITEISNNNIRHEKTYTVASPNDIIIFKNVKGYINKLLITDEQGNVTDVLHQRTLKKYVPIAIKSPILVVDKKNNPLDLSASFRLMDNGKYYFTNWAREVFEASDRLYLEMPVNGDTNIILYGIHGNYDKEKLYRVPSEKLVNSIDEAVSSYDSITGDLYTIQEEQVLILDKSIVEKYDSYIVDYLKADSYAINVTEDMKQYEVDISTAQDVVNVMYDMMENGLIRTYKSIETISPEDDRYIVLEKEEVGTL